jgi:hypothetical protein
MKKLLLLILTIGWFNSFAQVEIIAPSKGYAIVCRISVPSNPLFVINNKIVPKSYLALVDSAQIDSIQVIKSGNVSYTALYGSAAINGVTIVHTKKSIKWVTLEAVFDANNISQPGREQPIFFNGVEVEGDSILINQNNKLLFSVKTIRKRLKNELAVDKYLSITNK